MDVRDLEPSLRQSSQFRIRSIMQIIRATRRVRDSHFLPERQSCMFLIDLLSKILTTIVSTFTSYYVYLWSSYFPDKTLSAPMPSFDGRVIQYPTPQNLRDYMSWRQVDCTTWPSRMFYRRRWCTAGHINNLYNTTFWALVLQGGVDRTQAEEQLKVKRKNTR